MNTTATRKSAAQKGAGAQIPMRILEEGYGKGAWHGPDLKAALADVTAELAFWRPSPNRHSIAEIVLHHAYCIHAVRGQLTGQPQEPFVLEGEDWFEVSRRSRISWNEILAVVEMQQQRLAAVVADIGAGRSKSPLADSKRLKLVLGITCHAVYHAGQVQLLKRLRAD
jgi:hypothetical protein